MLKEIVFSLEAGLGVYCIWQVIKAEMILHRKFKVASTNIPEEKITLSDSNWSLL